MADYEIEELFRGTWRIQHRDGLSRAYVVRTYPGALVIDTGPLSSAGGLMAGLQAARVGLSSVRAVLLTGPEAGQTAGASRFLARSGAAAYCSPGHLSSIARSIAGDPPGPLERGQRFEDTLEVVSLGRSDSEATTLSLARDGAWFCGVAPDDAPSPPGLTVRFRLAAFGSKPAR